MTLNGSRPLSPFVRKYGHQTLSVTEVRTDRLQPGDTVLYDSKKYTVQRVRKEGHRWNVTLAKGSSLRSVTRPAGYVWPVLDNA